MARERLRVERGHAEKGLKKRMEQRPQQGMAGVLIASQGSPSVEQALARLSGEVGKKEQRRSGMTENNGRGKGV